MSIDEALKALEGSKASSIQFRDLLAICTYFFGKPRRNKASHYVFKMPWSGDPLVNIQDKGGNAKIYQVPQVIRALKKLKEQGK